MLEPLKEALAQPDKPFASTVHLHFWLKRDEVLRQVQDWVAKMSRGVQTTATTAAATTTTSETSPAGAWSSTVGLGDPALLGTSSASALLSGAKHSSRNMAAHLSQLKRHLASLTTLLADMPPPPQLKDSPSSN